MQGDLPEDIRQPPTYDPSKLQKSYALRNAPRSPSYAPFQPQRSRASRKARRQSRPADILNSMQDGSQNIYYMSTTKGRLDVSYVSPRFIMPGGYRRPASRSRALIDSSAPVSYYTLLSRYLTHLTAPTPEDAPLIFTNQEQQFLKSRRITQQTVKDWAVSLLQRNSHAPTRVFRLGAEAPPFFLVLLYLRRKHIRAYCLGIVLSHVASRLEAETINLQTLKTLVIRSLRHARLVWPESIPWITTFFLEQAAKIHGNDSDALSARAQSELTSFCNTLLSLLSLPASLRPMITARHQETAQFRVLQCMAGYNPSLAVTRTGFRAIARIQLTHAKTERERDWAELKGPSWPPWKENRTAMDEDKGYEYGASRASKILHRMFEGGYPARGWEEVAEVYAGWDTDLSPTIQTRIFLPSCFHGGEAEGLWAARIRTTRTRREAWACFLAYEASGAPVHQEVYLAIFEKLHYIEMQRRSTGTSRTEEDEEEDDVQDSPAATLLAGDMKEVMTEPSSPLNNVYLTEPVPSYEELYQRMTSKKIRPTDRLLAFLLETHPDFATIFKLLEAAKDDFDGGVGCLVSGVHDESSTVDRVPGYFLAAFIRFLCRFGHPTKRLSIVASTNFLPQDQHLRQFMFEEPYLLQYAYSLLLFYRPRYQPAWTAFVEEVVLSRRNSLYHEQDSAMGITNRQYGIVIKVLDTLAFEEDVDVEGDLFNLACTATRYAAQAVHKGNFPVDQGLTYLSKRSHKLRTLFHQLVGAHNDLQVSSGIPPHMPGPAELHAYVRALGVLRDYEGLYSFSTWFTKHSKEVTARARAQHGGSEMLFRTLVALKAATGGWLEEGRDRRPSAPEEIKQLIKAQINGVIEWGGWPSKKLLSLYIEGHVKSATPVVGGR